MTAGLEAVLLQRKCEKVPCTNRKVRFQQFDFQSRAVENIRRRVTEFTKLLPRLVDLAHQGVRNSHCHDLGSAAQGWPAFSLVKLGADDVAAQEYTGSQADDQEAESGWFGNVR